MIKSMTGFGRSERDGEDCRVTAEIKAVNHRYLDLTVKLPKRFSHLESKVRAVLKEYMERGKIDVAVSYEDHGDKREILHFNRQLAESYLRYFHQISDNYQLQNDMTVSALASLPEIFSMEQVPDDDDQLWQQLEPVIREAAERFRDSRSAEGESLSRDLTGKLDNLAGLLDQIEARSPEIVTAYRDRLLSKVRELLDRTQVDESLIATEVTAYADKICTDEETVRLRSHIAAVRKELQSGGSVGRKLDFIAQEMNREANTILSKANDLAVSDCGIGLKTEIEKIREQIQNLE